MLLKIWKKHSQDMLFTYEEMNSRWNSSSEILERKMKTDLNTLTHSDSNTQT